MRMLFSVRFSCQVAFSAEFYGDPCTSARGAQSGPTGALLGFSSTNIGWLEHYKRLVSLHSGWVNIELSSLLFNDVLLQNSL